VVWKGSAPICHWEEIVEIQVTSVMNDELVKELQRIAQRFMGKQVKVIIQEFNGEEKSRRRRE
jgi:hypothetical protein